MTQPPQIAPFVFSEPQERALNDALSQAAAGALTGTKVRREFTAEASSVELAISQQSTTFGWSAATTWWTMVRETARTTSKLTLAFSNPAAAGDVITVTLT